jgi:hypothetical protein
MNLAIESQQRELPTRALPSETMVMYDIDTRNGDVIISDPYLLHPDGRVDSLTATPIASRK